MKRSAFCQRFYAVSLVLLFVFCCGCNRKQVETVTFDFCFEGKTETVMIGEDDTLTPPAIVREGYTLSGWTLDGNAVADWSALVPEDGMVFRAVWENQREETKAYLDPDGGTCTVTEITLVPGEVCDLPIPVKEGYLFAGWYVEQLPGQGIDSFADWTGKTWEKAWEEVHFKAHYTVYPKELTVSFGSFEQDGDLSNGSEPVMWKVIAAENGKCLLISEKTLDGVFINKKGSVQVPYGSSSLRSWCLSFYQSALTAEEKEKVVPFAVSGTEYDSVFLLSADEVKEYLFDRDAFLKLDVTPYAQNRDYGSGRFEGQISVVGYTEEQRFRDRWRSWTRDELAVQLKDGTDYRYLVFSALPVYKSDHPMYSDDLIPRYGYEHGVIAGMRPAMWVDESVVTEAK